MSGTSLREMEEDRLRTFGVSTLIDAARLADELAAIKDLLPWPARRMLSFWRADLARVTGFAMPLAGYDESERYPHGRYVPHPLDQL